MQGSFQRCSLWLGRFSPAWNGNLALGAVVLCSLYYFLIGAEAREWASPLLRECLRVSVSTGNRWIIAFVDTGQEEHRSFLAWLPKCPGPSWGGACVCGRKKKNVFVFCTHGMIIFLPKERILVFWAMLSKLFRAFHGIKAGKGSRLEGLSLTHPWEWGHHSPCPLSFPSGSWSRLPASWVMPLLAKPSPGSLFQVLLFIPFPILFPLAITSCLGLPTSFLPSFLSLILPPGPLFPKLVCLRCWLWWRKWK